MDKIEELVFNCLAEVSDLFRPNFYKTKEKTILYGPNGCLDSLDLVSLLVVLESKLSELEGKKISISSDKVFSHRNSPFSTFETLVKFVKELL